MTRDEASTLSIESLTFNLGHDYWFKTSTASSDPMATVSRVTRSRHGNPPSLSASIDEWFAYITASHIQGANNCLNLRIHQTKSQLACVIVHRK